MEKFYLLVCNLLMIASVSVYAQTEGFSGFFRLANPGYGDVINAVDHYDFNCVAPTTDNAGSIVSIETEPMYSAITEIENLQKMYDEGLITNDEHLAMLQQVMVLGAWKSGFYPLKSLRVQGVDYIEMLKKIPAYADDAIEAYLNDEIPGLYTKHRNNLTLLCVFASDVINPTNLETVETFTAWAESYLTRWRNVADFGLYLQSINTVPEDENELPEPTGAYYIMFKTPVWVGNMKKAQMYINSILASDSTDGEPEQLDMWGSSKKRILKALSADYPEESAAYKFAEKIFSMLDMDTQYIIGETEEGDLYCQPLPDAFGTNGVTVTQEDIARCQWFFAPMDERNPLTVTFDKNNVDADGNYYSTLYTDFAYEVKTPGTKVFYASNVDETTSTPTLVEITGGVVPGQTPVIIKSASAEAADNVLLPTYQEVDPVEGNVLLGVYYAQENAGNMKSLVVKDNTPVFGGYDKNVKANSAYVEGEVDGISHTFSANAQDKIYDLQGRRVSQLSKKGIYIINGKTVVR